MVTTTLPVITKTCIGCGKLFETAWEFQLRCKFGCSRKREGRKQVRPKRKYVVPPLTFVGVDGEGVNLPNGEHHYVLLTVGKESLTNNGNTLTWREIFPFLYRQYLANPKVAFVGYYLGYDFTQWLRSLTFSRAEMLFSKHGIARRRRKRSGQNPMPFPVHVGDDENPWQWEIDILGLKRFMIRPGLGRAPKKDDENLHKWMYICDVGSFFQQSFMKTLTEWRKQDPLFCTDEEFNKVAKGKLKRATAKLDDEMLEYNVLECDLLARVMPSIDFGFRSFNVVLNRRQWIGPGQAAQKWLRSIKAPTAKAIRLKVPDWARDAARQTYFGGWFETFMSGHVPGTTWEYDVNSAYPSAIANLPCLLHGRWTQGKGSDFTVPKRGLLMVKAWVTGKDPWVGAMLHRTKDGKVLRPHQTSGWYWWHELIAAKKAGLVATIEVDEWVKYDGCKCEKPFKAIEELYLKRLEVGKNTPQGKAYKLIYNSSYGKMAQSIGQPIFANPIYASLITCGCRCKILKAIATHPRKTADLVKIATDGIYFRTPHPSLKLDDEKLGFWSVSKKQNLTVFMPGLYWDDESRARIREAKKKEDVDLKLKSRGVPARDLAASIGKIDELFRKFRAGKRWPQITLNINFAMVSPKQAVERRKWGLCGTVTSNAKRTISSNPGVKRSAFRKVEDVIRTFPFERSKEVSSTAYDRHFGEDMEEELDLDIMTPEGNLREIIHEAVMG
jgi:hypothetical protein